MEASNSSETAAIFRLFDEVLDLVIEFLDILSFVSISQTCRYIRRVAAPSRHTQLQLILYLELHDEVFGSQGFARRLNDSERFEPELNFGDECPLSRIEKYACVCCLRLRDSTWFDMASIRQLPFRKPPLDSRAARSSEIIERGSMAQVWGRRRAESARIGDDDLCLWKRHRDLKRFWRTRFEQRLALEDANFDGGYLSVEEAARWWEIENRELVGMQRRRRFCIECHAARGDYKRITKTQGNPVEHMIHMTRGGNRTTETVGIPNVLRRLTPLQLRQGTILVTLGKRGCSQTAFNAWLYFGNRSFSDTPPPPDPTFHPPMINDGRRTWRSDEPTEYVKGMCGTCHRWFDSLSAFGFSSGYLWELGDWRCLECKCQGKFAGEYVSAQGDPLDEDLKEFMSFFRWIEVPIGSYNYWHPE